MQDRGKFTNFCWNPLQLILQTLSLFLGFFLHHFQKEPLLLVGSEVLILRFILKNDDFWRFGEKQT